MMERFKVVLQKMETDSRADFFSSFPLEKVAKESSGVIPWEGKNYFYMQLTPFPTLDLHFFLLNPEEKEFALLNDLVAGSHQIVDTMLFNIHILGLLVLAIAFLLLHLLSRKITKPISQLALATEEIAQGNYDPVNIPNPPLSRSDEISTLCHAFREMVQGLQEKEKVKGVLNKVVSTEIAQEILKGNVHLGGEEKRVTVLFADIRNFTNMTQRMPPKEVIDLLNQCMTKLSVVIDRNGGVIDKYVGDEVMALFGAPLAQPDSALKAILSALQMRESLHLWNQERKARGEPSVEIGIGIHTGAMLAGNMGADNRLNYTVIGSNVDLAARICSAAQGMEILISESTWEEPHVKEHLVTESVPPTVFKGFDTPVPLYRVVKQK